MAGTIGGIGLFFCAYFPLLHYPVNPVTTVPLLALDERIPFQPAFLSIYLSLWLYLALPVALLESRRELASHAQAATLMGLAGLGVFYFWPTAVPPRPTGWSSDSASAFLQKIDAAGNAFPSLHVAFAVLAAVWLDRVLRQIEAGAGARCMSALWGAAIVYSTLATRQHVVLDVLGGAVLGSGVAVLHAWARRRSATSQLISSPVAPQRE